MCYPVETRTVIRDLFNVLNYSLEDYMLNSAHRYRVQAARELLDQDGMEVYQSLTMSVQLNENTEMEWRQSEKTSRKKRQRKLKRQKTVFVSNVSSQNFLQVLHLALGSTFILGSGESAGRTCSRAHALQCNTDIKTPCRLT